MTTLGDRLKARSMPVPIAGCTLWLGAVSANGYGCIAVRVAGVRTTVSTHRAAYEAHVGPVPDGLEVCHSCDVKLCIRPAHLFLGTHGDNMADMKAKGRRKGRGCGMANGRAVLTDHQVRSIRAEPRNADAVANDYGVSADYVRKLRTGARRAA